MELAERGSLHRALHTEMNKLSCFPSVVPLLWDCIVDCPKQAGLWTDQKAGSNQLIRVNKEVLIMACEGLHDFWLHLLTSPPYSLCSGLRRILPRCLCTCCALYLVVQSFPSYQHSLVPCLLQTTLLTVT